MIKTLQANSPRRKPQHPLSQRELLNTIDLLPQIIKQDKLFLRNKIKQIFKDHQLNQCIPNSQYEYGHQYGHNYNSHRTNDGYQLLSIFSECKKPLNKIHLFQNHWHWLQVRLRKYIGGQKKKIKDECVSLFRRERLVEKGKNSNNQFKRKFKEDLFSNRKENKYVYETNIKANKSQENKRPQSPNNSNYQFCQTARLRNLSGNASPKYGTLTNQFRGPQTCKNANNVCNYSNQNNNWNQANNTRTASCLTKPLSGYQYFRKQVHSQSKQKHSQPQPLLYNPDTDIASSSLHHKFLQQQQEQIQKQINKISNPSRLKQQQDADLDIYEAYQFTDQSQYRNRTKRPHDNFVIGEEFSSIKGKEQVSQRAVRNDLISNFYENNAENEGLFTSPQLLQQCRRLIEMSTKLTKSRTKQKSKQKSQAKLLKQSTNAFQKIKYPDRSPQFAKQLPKFKDIKDILQHIFYKDWNVYISATEKQELFERCPQQCLSSLQLILNQIEQPTKFLNFLQIFPIIKNHLNVKFIFSNIFLLLDIDSKGAVQHTDYQTFIQNFTDSPIDPQIYEKLKQNLYNFQKVTNQIFKDRTQIVEGCYQYVQLIGRKEIFQLGEILQLFQFQIDTGNGCQKGNWCQGEKGNGGLEGREVWQ